MRSSKMLALCATAAVLISFGVGAVLQAQAPGKPAKVEPAEEAPKETAIVNSKAFPPRAAVTDYPAHVQVGMYTIGADFAGHSLPTQEGLLHSEDYVVIEAGINGPPEARLMLSLGDFSLRINGNKKPVAAEPYELAGKSVKDPDYQEPETNKSSKTMVNTGGGKADGTDPNAPPPALIPIPFEIKRGWQLRVKRDSLPIGDRALPVAGLLFFSHGAGVKSIRSMELIYSGPAGKVTIPIHP